MHFPDDRDLGYFNQLLAERLVYKVVAGQRFSIWEQFPAGLTKRSTASFTAMPRCAVSNIWG
jgi:hypothetical protein